jgi:hypothetical protein
MISSMESINAQPTYGTFSQEVLSIDVPVSLDTGQNPTTLGTPMTSRLSRSLRRSLPALVVAGLIAATASTASAHMGIYVNGIKGDPIAASGNGTYALAFSIGHGCAGPRTVANPDGNYDSTSLEIFMPRNTDGSFLLDGSAAAEPQIVNSASYRATAKYVVVAGVSRVSSVVFDKFVLPASNNGVKNKDTNFLTIGVKLPSLATLKAKTYPIAAGGVAASATAAKIYFPSMQYCDVTSQGVGIQAATSTPATITDTKDPACTSVDAIQTTLIDEWQTKTRTPSVTIIASGTPAVAASTLEYTGNSPSLAPATASKYCSDPTGYNPRTLAMADKFSASYSATTKTLTVRVAGSALHSGRKYAVKTATGTILGTATLNINGNASVKLKGTAVSALKVGDSIRLTFRGALVGADPA